MPVITSQKTQKKQAKQLNLDQKLAKLAIADFWTKDSDNTRYYINAVSENGKTWVRFRIDIQGSKPLIILLEPKMAYMIGMALQRAAFSAQVLKPDEIAKMWNFLTNKKRSNKQVQQQTQQNEQTQEAGQEVTQEDTDMPDISFA